MRKSHQDRLLAQSVHNATLPEFLRSVHVPKTMVNRTFDSLSLSKVLSLSETASCNLHQTHWYHTVLCCQDTRGKHGKTLQTSTLLHEIRSSKCRARQTWGNINLLCWQHVKPFASLQFDFVTGSRPRPNRFFLPAVPSSDAISWPWHELKAK